MSGAHMNESPPSERQRCRLVYARDDQLCQAPAEQLQRKISALEEENRRLANCISQIRSSQQSIVEGDSSLPGGSGVSAHGEPRSEAAASSSNEVLMPPAPQLRPPGQAVMGTPYVARVRESGPGQGSPMPAGQKLPSPVQAAPDSSSLNASTASCEAVPSEPAVYADAASTVQASPALSHAAAQAEAKAAFLEAAAKRGSGFAEVYNELLSCALQVLEARASAASMEKERNKASTEARELRACNARLEEAVSVLQDRNKELYMQKEFQRLGAKTSFQNHHPCCDTALSVSPGRQSVWAAPLSPAPASPRDLRPGPGEAELGLRLQRRVPALQASTGVCHVAPVIASPMQQRLALAARLPPQDQQTQAFQQGWRLFHQLSKEKEASSLDCSARQRASALMLGTKKGMPTEFRENPAVCAVWREALLAGASLELSSAQSFSSIPSMCSNES
ncbi:NEK1 [Symbiodinium pilosum]|uniref:NEK1 protein n=1 Tax=Symbiodinium pilosum TaxID=2952 RepID=A0A812LFB9_SYMPI|nr:NEK1 [Symbiodinium pilosum]